MCCVSSKPKVRQAARYLHKEFFDGSSPRTRGIRHRGRRTYHQHRFIPVCTVGSGPTYTTTRGNMAHPRVRGGYGQAGLGTGPNNGSSPHIRRGRTGVRHGRYYQGFIPAYTGDTLRPKRAALATPVHPRAHGGYLEIFGARPQAIGSSPHARGILRAKDQSAGILRFIPAYTRDTFPISRAWLRRAVHPRVRGEYKSEKQEVWCVYGSSPRTRGILEGKQNRVKRLGSSPRTRGILLSVGRVQTPTRFIPAYAGDTRSGSLRCQGTPVHPRVRGGYPIGLPRNEYRRGSSPRTRGIRQPDHCPFPHGRFIPAYAGDTLLTTCGFTTGF